MRYLSKVEALSVKEYRSFVDSALELGAMRNPAAVLEYFLETYEYSPEDRQKLAAVFRELSKLDF